MDHRPPLWRDRRDAGRALAERLSDLQGQANRCTLVALPRGGVPVAAAMAQRLGLPLVTWAVRKLAHPACPEVAIGAVAPGGVVLWDPQASSRLSLEATDRDALVATQERELDRRRQVFADPEPAALTGRHLVVVDDGIATGMTAKAVLHSLQALGPASLTLAVPVVDRRVAPDLEALVDRLEVLAVVERLRAVDEWYEHFEQLDDADVLALLRHGGDAAPS
jgi:putative phosphoribosyl transferase